jgi:TusA-related sulfurtransferase
MQYNYDATNEKCPLPLVKTRVMLKKMQKGDSCIVKISDKGSRLNIPKFLTEFAFDYSIRHLDSQTLELHINK